MKTILIVGGGPAGLSAGIHAQKNGYQATICEKLNVTGGCLSFWERDGYHIDNCIHWLIGTNKNTKMYKRWCELGVLGNTDIYKKPYLFTSHVGTESLSLSRDINKFQNDMLNLSPNDAHEINSFIKATKTLEGFFKIAGENHNEKKSLMSLICRTPNLIKYYNLSLEDLAQRFHHPVIKDFLVSFMPENFNSLALIFTIANFCGDNADLPIGGSVSLSKNLKERFLSLGGTIEYNMEAVKIKTNGKRVTSVLFSNGKELFADEYIITIDPAQIFGKIIDCPMPKALASQYKKLKRFSAIQCAFECNVPSLPFEGEQTLVINKELKHILPGHHVILRYERHEPSYSPKGKSLLQTMIYCSEESAIKYIETRNNNKEEYIKQKNELAKKISELIVHQFPFLDGKIKTIDVWTPATYHRIVSTQMGSFMSFAFSKKCIPIEIKNKVKNYDNLMIAGQWLQMPGGLPTAVKSGKKAIVQLMKKNH